MDFKDFSFSPDIRVSMYRVGDENLACHRHAHVSDITYCASGRLMLELPALGSSYIFHPGQFIQVPANTVHRVSHCAQDAASSSYILVQIGPFSIDFEREAGILPGPDPVDLGGTRLGYRIGGAREHLLSVARQWRDKRPAGLSDAEHASILGVLDTICQDGIALAPDRAQLLAQFRALAAGSGGVPADHSLICGTTR